MITEMFSRALKVQQNAYAPYSKFLVGVCVRSEQDELFVGCNVENASYGLTNCAEVNAISSLVAAGHKRCIEVVIVGSGSELITPCGRCRQVLREFAVPNMLVHLCDTQGLRRTMTLETLLPDAFGPAQLGYVQSAGAIVAEEAHDTADDD